MTCHLVLGMHAVLASNQAFVQITCATASEFAPLLYKETESHCTCEETKRIKKSCVAGGTCLFLVVVPMLCQAAVAFSIRSRASLEPSIPALDSSNHQTKTSVPQSHFVYSNDSCSDGARAGTVLSTLDLCVLSVSEATATADPDPPRCDVCSSPRIIPLNEGASNINASAAGGRRRRHKSWISSASTIPPPRSSSALPGRKTPGHEQKV
ncbi:hypothetical protein MUK42_35663 [Musa troglodytarum]|uniref:Uncharacterized protein n=1 Tax=Musa troglodytarum TaxID=320322 RepID=A0A9E7FEF7_9LILI|nr:hypothetical protein MUK42_35663 [Musa troglodytarum]